MKDYEDTHVVIEYANKETKEEFWKCKDLSDRAHGFIDRARNSQKIKIGTIYFYFILALSGQNWASLSL